MPILASSLTGGPGGRGRDWPRVCLNVGAPRTCRCPLCVLAYLAQNSKGKSQGINCKGKDQSTTRGYTAADLMKAQCTDTQQPTWHFNCGCQRAMRLSLIMQHSTHLEEVLLCAMHLSLVMLCSTHLGEVLYLANYTFLVPVEQPTACSCAVNYV